MPQTKAKAPLEILATAENVLAVRHGLALQAGDIALSVAGSGDLPLAMLELVSNVVVIDAEPLNLRYLRLQVEALGAGDYLGFLRPDMLVKADPILAFEGNGSAQDELAFDLRRQYFTLKRLTGIRQNLNRLVMAGETVTVGEALELLPFNKAYLTKTGGYSKADFAEYSLLSVCAKIIQPDGLIYVSNGAGHRDFLKLMRRLGYAFEEHLTAVARALEPKGQPTVFKKTELY